MNILIQDPILSLELFAIVLTVIYLFRLAFGPAPANEYSSSNWPRAAERQAPQSFLSANWLFAVGTLISVPKRSLRSQGWLTR